MAIPANIIIGWPSTAASIPSGWTRETALDGRYIVGAAASAAADLSTDRGSSSHTHTSPSHTPIQNSHTHLFYTLGNDASPTQAFTSGTNVFIVSSTHSHDVATSLGATAVNDPVSITVDATSNDLAYALVIWIKSNGTPTQLPLGCVALFASDALPAGWTRVFADRYLKGAAAGGDGGTTGGSNTHNHTSPAHTHTQQPHSHGATTSSTATGISTRKNTTSAVNVSGALHTHSVSLNATTGTNQAETTVIASSNHEPPYKKLNIIQSSAADLPLNIIALWGGADGNSIPDGWDRFTSMDGKWHKGANIDGESNSTTGGSSQHNHTASDCAPVIDPHSHTGTDGGASAVTAAVSSSGAARAAKTTHTHSGWIGDPADSTNNPCSVTIDNCAAEAAYPPYRTVIFIQYTNSAPKNRVGVSGITTYQTDELYNRADISGGPLPEELARIWAGDRRFMRQEEPL